MLWFFYITCALTANGTVVPDAHFEMVNGRASATEFRWGDAGSLLGKAKKRWPTFVWQIDKTYSGKFVVRGESETQNFFLERE